MPVGTYRGWRADDAAGVSRAPVPGTRALVMSGLGHGRLHVSVEPVLNFDLQCLVEWVERIGPEQVAVGYATGPTKKCLGMEEPPRGRVEEFVERVRGVGVGVDVKELREKQQL